MDATTCLRDARMFMPSFIAAVLERGVKHLAFVSALSGDMARAAALKRASATLHEARLLVAHEFVRAVDSELSREESAPVPGAMTRAGLDICLDDSLAARLDLAHLQDAAELSCTSERIRFDSLFGGARGDLILRAPNPLRPEALARCLATALDTCRVPGAVRDAWFTHLGTPLGLELPSLYGSLARVMTRAGVREAEFMPPVASVW
jgi:hypothetical protein